MRRVAPQGNAQPIPHLRTAKLVVFLFGGRLRASVRVRFAWCVRNLRFFKKCQKDTVYRQYPPLHVTDTTAEVTANSQQTAGSPPAFLADPARCRYICSLCSYSIPIDLHCLLLFGHWWDYMCYNSCYCCWSCCNAGGGGVAVDSQGDDHG